MLQRNNRTNRSRFFSQNKTSRKFRSIASLYQKTGYIVRYNFTLFIQIFAITLLTIVFFAFFYVADLSSEKVYASEDTRVDIINHFYTSNQTEILQSVNTAPKNTSQNTVESAKISIYRVKVGDNLYDISTLLGVTIQDLANLNNLSAPYNLKVDQEIKFIQN